MTELSDKEKLLQGSKVERTSNRPQRQPVSQRKILSAPQRSGYVRRWVNDVEGRVKLFEEGGWKPVVDSTIETADNSRLAEGNMGSIISRHVGGGRKAVLMEIKEEWFKEDQLEKEKKVLGGMKAITQNRSEGQYGKIEINK